MKRNVAVSALRLILFLLTATASAQPIAPHYKTVVVESVLKDLVRAINSSSRDPKVIVDPQNHSVAAYYEPNGNVINMGERFYDLCTKFGADSLDALASVLAHELAHWELGHSCGSIPRSKREHEVFKRNVPGDIKNREAQADCMVGFYGRQAGYDPLKVFPDVLQRIYEVYGLDDTMEGYPSLSHRKRIAWNVRERMDTLGVIYDAGNSLSLARRYSQAQQCFDYIIGEFPSREIRNNAGVAYTLHALELMSDTYAGYVYPLELDVDTRLRGVGISQGKINRDSRGTDPPDSIWGARNLDSAAVRFDLAMQVDPYYMPARINRATIHILKQEYGPAEALIRDVLEQDISDATRVRAYALLAVMLARRGEVDRATELLNEIEGVARDNGIDALIKANRAVIEGGSFQGPQGLGWGKSTETIGGITADEEMIDGRLHLNERIGRKSDSVIARISHDATVIRVISGKSWVQFVCTRDDYDRFSEGGIGIGSAADDVRSSYGNEPRIVYAPQGRYFIYDYSKIIFLIDHEGKVKRWMIYAMGE